MDEFNNPRKKSGEFLSLPSWKNIPQELPELNIGLRKQDNNLPFFDVEEPLFQNSNFLPELNSSDLDNKKGPIFIRTDDYRKVLDCIDSMKSYVKEGPDIILMLKNLKKNQDMEQNKYMEQIIEYVFIGGKA